MDGWSVQTPGRDAQKETLPPPWGGRRVVLRPAWGLVAPTTAEAAASAAAAAAAVLAGAGLVDG